LKFFKENEENVSDFKVKADFFQPPFTQKAAGNTA